MQFNCQEELGGVAELNFYLLTEVSNWPLVITDQNSSQIILNQEPVSVEATLVPDSIVAQINNKKGSEGIVYEINIKLAFITRSESLEQLLDQYQNKPGVVLLKLNNEFQKLYGTDEQPLIMNYEVIEGSKIDGDSSTELTIKGMTRQRPVYYTVSL